MIIKPKIRGFICTNAHPDGCAAQVSEQVSYIQQFPAIEGAKNALIIGASTGYGLASRITAAFGCGANTLGIFFEKPATETRTASAGYYNSAAFHRQARAKGLYADSLNCDAFASASKALVIDKIKADLGKLDLIVYSLASPRRIDPITGEVYSSVLKPVGEPVTRKSVNTSTGEVHEVTLETATEQEIAHTVKVMGGEDWELWIQALVEAKVLAQGCKTIAYTYVGKSITWPIYGNATIGKAKEDLQRASIRIQQQLLPLQGEGRIAVLKGLVTQSSSAIPVMPLYISILYKVMKESGVHEGCIEQISNLFRQCLYSQEPIIDDEGRFRVDGKELDEGIQSRVKQLWEQINTDNLNTLSDYEGYQAEFLKLFGFGYEQIDYDRDVNQQVPL